MTGVDPARLAYHLRRLDATSCPALVADLWSARGFQTEREGAVVVATRHGESRVIHVPAASARPPRPVDVVVSIGGGRPNVAADVRVLDAADIARMLLYAVDRDVAADVCARHLGAPPSDLPPPPSTRLRARAVSVASSVRSRRVVLAVGLCVLLLAGATYTPPPVDGDHQSVVARPTTPAAPPSSTPATDGRDVADRRDAAVGVGPSGVTNRSALSAAHSHVLANRSYTVWVDYSRPRGWDPDGVRVGVDTDVVVDGERFSGVTTLERGATRTPLQEVYYDGTDWYVADASGNETTYRRIRASKGAPTLYADPSTLRYTLVDTYLATPETSATKAVDHRGHVVYRVVGRGRPPGLGVPRVENYTVVAYVDSRGLVRDLTARYRRETDDGSVRVVVEVTYDRLGATTVTPPSWYDREFGNETRGDSTEMRTHPHRTGAQYPDAGRGASFRG